MHDKAGQDGFDLGDPGAARVGRDHLHKNDGQARHQRTQHYVDYKKRDVPAGRIRISIS